MLLHDTAARELIAMETRARAEEPENARPGAELHPAVHGALALVFAATLAPFALVFWSDGETMFQIVICAVYLAMYLATPALMIGVGGRSARARSLAAFLKMSVQTATCRMTGAAVAVQILTIPIAILAAASGICLIVARAAAPL